MSEISKALDEFCRLNGYPPPEPWQRKIFDTIQGDRFFYWPRFAGKTTYREALKLRDNFQNGRNDE